MVNETNKPQQSIENEQLGQRLRNSNQALADMQAEHHQLLEEMEQLRKRAEDLQRLREQQEREKEKKLEYKHNIAKTTKVLQCNEKPNNLVQNSEEQKTENNRAADVAEADYIKEKLTEIARLKAQFKRVQLMINTTELIENHISKNEAGEKQLEENENNIITQSENTTMNKTISSVSTTDIITSDPEIVSISDMTNVSDLNPATTTDEKEQLMLTMLNMFKDFSSDLKSQADNLRAERERIKELKESIIRSRKEQNK